MALEARFDGRYLSFTKRSLELLGSWYGFASVHDQDFLLKSLGEGLAALYPYRLGVEVFKDHVLAAYKATDEDELRLRYMTCFRPSPATRKSLSSSWLESTYSRRGLPVKDGFLSPGSYKRSFSDIASFL